MPPKKGSNVLNKDGNTAMKKGRKRGPKKDKECPSRVRKTDRVVLNGQARDIIQKVYEFMKKEALAEYAERLTNARWRTAVAVGVSEKTVSRILNANRKKAETVAGPIVIENELGSSVPAIELTSKPLSNTNGRLQAFHP